MRFRLYREHGALNSVPIFDAFEKGLNRLGHEIVNSHEQISVIWSVLWTGRMKANREIYNHCVTTGKPIVIIEVGNLIRNNTWRISLNHINNLGYFGNTTDLDPSRPKKLGIFLADAHNRRPEILIATQHQQSLQWEGQPPMSEWVNNLVRQIRTYSNRKIVVRPHPRSQLSLKNTEITIQVPEKIIGSYDNFDIDYNFHCVINHNSGPSVQAAIKGVPVICDSSSLAAKISQKIENIENLQQPDRTQWFLELCHTEWTVDEIAQGLPLARLLPKISEKIC